MLDLVILKLWMQPCLQKSKNLRFVEAQFLEQRKTKQKGTNTHKELKTEKMTKK